MESVISENKIKSYSSYKYSGEDWIGNIPESWEISRLASILTAVSINNRSELPLLSITREKGVIVRDTDSDDENHNFIPDDLSNYKFLPKGYFGMNKMKAWQGSYGISAQDGIVSPAYYIFKLGGDLDSQFFHLAIRSKLYVEYFGSASDGVRIGQWDLSKSRMKNIPFLIPPLHEQTAIASFLDKKTALIDQAIEIKQKQIELLKERKQILIQKAVTRGLNPNVKMKDSGVEWIGEIPEHWEVDRIKFHINFVTGFPFKSEKYSETGIKLARGINVKEGEFNWEETKYWPKVERHLKPFLLKAGDILIGMDGSKVGKNFCQVAESDLPILLVQRVARLRVLRKLTSDYLFCQLQNVNFLKWILMSKTDPMIPHISPADINNYSVAIPPLNEQNEIVLLVKHISERSDRSIKLLSVEIEKLKEYKSTLINSAVTGKIKVC